MKRPAKRAAAAVAAEGRRLLRFVRPDIDTDKIDVRVSQ
jgi:hypothetical protein